VFSSSDVSFEGTSCFKWEGSGSPVVQLLNWTDLGQLLPGTGSPLSKDFPLTNAPAGFFRVRAN
jgi:hypothetical protein